MSAVIVATAAEKPVTEVFWGAYLSFVSNERDDSAEEKRVA